MKMTMAEIRERKHARFYIYRKKKTRNVFIYKKARHFAKSKKISVTFLYTKRKTLYVTQF